MLLDELTDNRKRILIAGAHPDDIEFSTGRLILRRKGLNTTVICMTDGRKGQQGTKLKKIIPEKEYAKLRINESMKALKELHISIDNIYFLGLPDQELVSNPYIIDKLYFLVKKIQPDLILVPPWEGAHPDHDATHLFFRIALKNLSYPKKQIIEYSSYNNHNGSFNIQRFIPFKDIKEFVFTPRPNEQKRWKNIMKIFKSQKNQQENYIPKSKYESYRKVPDYDYSKLPYSRKQSEIIRELFNPVYPFVRKILPKKDKLFYETWANINPMEIKDKLKNHIQHYGLK